MSIDAHMRQLTADRKRVEPGTEFAVDLGTKFRVPNDLIGLVYRGFGYLFIVDRIEHQYVSDARWGEKEEAGAKSIIIWRQKLTSLESMEVSLD